MAMSATGLQDRSMHGSCALWPRTNMAARMRVRKGSLSAGSMFRK